MPVPASIIEILETNNIAYQLKATKTQIAQAKSHLEPAKPGACLVKSLLLQDAQGQLQILLPAEHMLNLSAIKSQFGRNLEPLPSDELSRMLEKEGLQVVPAIPEWRGFSTLVDATLLRQQTLLLDTGDSNELLELKLSDFQDIVKTANIGELSISAPRVPDSDEMDQEQILHSLKSFTELRIKKRLEETLELPPLPETAQRIIKLRADPDADISDLSTIVELDPSLAAQVVSWASSPYYSAPGKVKSVHDAIVRVLGFDMVLNLALGLALGKAMNNKAMNPQQIREYWYSAVCTAATVEGLVTSIPREQRPSFGMSYLSGLLNNFGQLVLAEVFPPYFANLTQHFEVNPHISQASIEQQLIGVSSCQITAWLMQSWNMPEEVVTAMRHQNNPNYSGENSAYSKLNFIARQLLANKGLGHGDYKEIDERLFIDLDLERETAEATVTNILESADDLRAISDKIQG